MNRSAQDKVKTILFVNLYSEMGGGEYAIYNLLKHIDRTKFRPVMMFNQRGTFTEKVERLGIETVLLPYQVVMLRDLIYPKRFCRMLKSSREITAYLKQNRADVIQCSDVLAMILIAIPVLRFRIPVVYSVIFFYEWMRILLFNVLAILLVEKIITNSSTVREYLRRRTLFLSRKLEVVYQGIDKSMFRPTRNGDEAVLRRELGLDDNTKLVGMVGRFDPAKGHKVFLEAASIVLQERPDVRFVVVGGVLFTDVFPFFKDYHDDVMKYYHQFQLEGSVSFIPQREDMPEVMRSLDLLVLPSIREGFGLVLLEALASGVPAVASGSAGAIELIKDIPSVYVAESGKAISFAEKILKALTVLENPDRTPRRNSNESAAQLVLNTLDWSENVKKMEALYATV